MSGAESVLLKEPAGKISRRSAVVIFGGSFDPPHRGHILLLERAISSLRPEKTIIVPTYHSPFKKGHYSPFRHRKKMLEILLEHSPARKDSRISDFEEKRKRKTYAFEIVNAVSQENPGKNIFFLMGSDSLKSFHKWKNSSLILKKAGLLVGKRKGFKMPTCLGSKIRSTFLKGLFPNISSTKIRNDLFSGKIRDLDPQLKTYARRHNLYNYRLSQAVKKLLSTARFLHTTGTARLALELARIHGVNESSASAAAILHDCAKELPLKRQIRLARKAGFPEKCAKDILEKAPSIVHQWAGAALAASRFGVTDPDILSAIASHSSSHKKMSKLAKLIYVADFAGYDRKFPQAGQIRRLAMKNLEEAYRKTLSMKQSRLKKNGKWLYE